MFMQNSYAQARAGPMIPLVEEKKFYQTHSQRPFISLTHQPNLDNSPINIYTRENGYNGVLTDATVDKNFEANFESRMKEKSPLNFLKYETKLLQNKEFIGLTDPRKNKTKSVQKKHNLLNKDEGAFVNNRIKLPSYAICLQANIEPKNFSVLKSYYELMARDSHLAILNKRQLLAKIVEASTGRSQSQQNTSQLQRSDLRPQEKTFHYADVSNFKDFQLSDPRSSTIVTMGNIRVKEFLDRRSLKGRANQQPNEYASRLVKQQENTASMESVTTDCMRKSVVNFKSGLDSQQAYDVVEGKDDHMNTATDHMVSEKILPMVAMFESHRCEHQDDRHQTAQIGSSRSKKKQIDIKTTVYQHPEGINTLKNGSSQYQTSLRLDCEETPLAIGGSAETLKKHTVESLQISEIETSIRPKTFTEMKASADVINQEEIESYLYHLYYNKQVMKPQSFYFTCDNAEYRDNKRDSQRAKNSKLESLARRQKFLQKESTKDNILTIKKIAQCAKKERDPKIHHSVATSTTYIEEEPPMPFIQITTDISIDALAQNQSITIEKPISRVSETLSDFDQVRLSAARKQMMAYVDHPVVSEIRVRSNQGIRKGYENIAGQRYTNQGFQYLDTNQAVKVDDYNAPPTDLRHDRGHSSIYEQSEMNEELVRVSMYQVGQEQQGNKCIEPALVDSLSLSLMPKASQEPFIVLQWGEPINNYKFGDSEPEQNSLYRSKSRLKPRKVIKRPATQMQHKQISSQTNDMSRSVGGITGIPPPQNRHLYVDYNKISDRSAMSKTQMNLFKVDLKNMNNVNIQIENCYSDLAKSIPSPINANTTLTAFHNIPSPQFAKETNPSKVQTAIGGSRNQKSSFAGNNKMEIPYVPLQATSRDVSMHSFKKSNNFNDDYSPKGLQPREVSQSQLGNYLSTERDQNPTMMNSSLTKIPQIKANVIKLPKSDSMEDVLLAHLSKPNTNLIKLKTKIHQESRKLAQSALAESAPIELIVRNKKQNKDYILNQKQVAVNFVLQMEHLFNKRNPSVEHEASVKHQSTQAFEIQDSQILAICDQNDFVDQHSQKSFLTQDQKVWKAFQKERTLRQKRFQHKNGTLIKNLKPKHALISLSVIRD